MFAIVREAQVEEEEELALARLLPRIPVGREGDSVPLQEVFHYAHLEQQHLPLPPQLRTLAMTRRSHHHSQKSRQNGWRRWKGDARRKMAVET